MSARLVFLGLFYGETADGGGEAVAEQRLFDQGRARLFLLCGLAVQAGSLSELVRMATIAKLF